MSGNQGLFSIKNEIGIINFALSQLSIDPIPSINENTKIADEMRRDFQIAKESILRTYVFDWAHKAEKLIQFADPNGGYQKPADYINFIGLGTCDQFCCCADGYKNLSVYTHTASVREVNSRLYINTCCSNYCYEYIHYSYNNQNYTDMPTDLLESIAYHLAYISCMRLTKSESLTEYLRQRRDEVLNSAKKHSGLEHRAVQNPYSALYSLVPPGGFY